MFYGNVDNNEKDSTGKNIKIGEDQKKEETNENENQ